VERLGRPAERDCRSPEIKIDSQSKDLSGITASLFGGSRLREDHREAAKDYRRRKGRLAGDPKAQFRLVVAFVKHSGLKMHVGFADGTTATWNPQAYIDMRPGPRPRTGSPGEYTTSGTLLENLLTVLASAPQQSASVTHPRSLLPTGVDASELQIAITAAAKWRLITMTRDHRVGQLSPTGTIWHDATAGGHTRRVQRRSQYSGKGGSVTYNIQGPTNFIQGSNYGVMQSSQNVPISRDDLLAALNSVLSISSIPWGQGELVQVRHGLCQAVAKNEPERARAAVRKLRQIVEQLVLGIGSNAAYQLLINHFK
jgi:hypothetical protein